MPLNNQRILEARQREFYTEKAESHKFLEEVVAGDTTFRERLDWLMIMYTITVIEFGEYLDILTEIGATGLDKKELTERYNALYWGGFKDAGQYIFLCTLGLGALLCAVGPLVVVEPLLVAAGGGGIAALRKKRKYLADARIRKDEIFEPVYRAAENLDKEIGTIFLLDHFRDNRERFEETYAGMSEHERETTGEMLYGYLAAGGIPGMDEQSLNDYLSGLLISEAGGEA